MRAEFLCHCVIGIIATIFSARKKIKLHSSPATNANMYFIQCVSILFTTICIYTLVYGSK